MSPNGLSSQIDPAGICNAQAIRVRDHFFLRIRDPAQIVVVIVAPPDTCESPRRRHDRWSCDRVVSFQNIRVGGAI
jgi:hypothetical protein